MTTEPYRISGPGYHGPMALHPKSRAYDPTYRPSKSLAHLVVDKPDSQFLADRLAEQRGAQERTAKGRAWVARVFADAVRNAQP